MMNNKIAVGLMDIFFGKVFSPVQIVYCHDYLPGCKIKFCICL